MDQGNHQQATNRPLPALFNYFMKMLVKEVGQFMRTEIKWGVIGIGLLSLAFTTIRLRFRGADVFENLFGLFGSAVWSIFLSALVVIYKTTKRLWPEVGPLRVQLIAICAVLMMADGIAGGGLGWFAYRTAIPPRLTQEELAEFGSTITVQIVAPKPVAPNHEPEWISLGTGFWVGEKGYVVTCYDKIRDFRDLNIATPAQPYLGGNITINGAVFYRPSAIIWKDERSNVAVLRPVQLIQLFLMHRPVNISVPELATDLAKTGENVLLSGLYRDSSTSFFDPKFGHVVRTDADYNENSHSQYALFLSIPFGPLDCGAPVLNYRGTVVGMAERALESPNSESSVRTVAMPSAYIRSLLKQVDMTH